MGLSAVFNQRFNGYIAHARVILAQHRHFLRHKLCIGAENILSVKQNLSALWTEISAHCPYEGRFSAAVGANYGLYLSTLYIKAYAVKDTGISVACAKISHR